MSINPPVQKDTEASPTASAIVRDITFIEPEHRQVYAMERIQRRRSPAVAGAGLTLAVAIVIAIFAFTSKFSLWSFTATMMTFLGFGLAATMMAWGSRLVDIEERPLFWINASLGVLRVRESEGQEELVDSTNIYFEDVDQVLFAMTRHPLLTRGRSALVDAFAVHVRLYDGTVATAVPPALSKESAFRAAVIISNRVGCMVKQVGIGWRSDL